MNDMIAVIPIWMMNKNRNDTYNEDEQNNG